MKRFALLALALTVLLLVPACGMQKKSAETAIAGVESAFNAIKEQAVNVVPDQAKTIEDAIAAAKAQADKGDFKAALETTKDLPAKVKELSDGLAAKQAELQQTWAGLNAALPGAVASLSQKLGAMKKPPAGMDKAALDAAKTGLAEMKTKWGEATTAMQGGKWAEAAAKAGEVKTSAVALMTELKMSVPDGLK
jgi:uncharacterized protein YoxC